MTRREAWRDYICAPEHAGRYLSTIGRAVSGAVSEAVNRDVLESFLNKLRDADGDTRLLADAVDLTVGSYVDYATRSLPRILDSLANEMVAREEVVGPALCGNPRWDRTVLRRMSGTLSPSHYVSRTAHRSFEMPENLLLSWLVEDLRRTVGLIEHRVGSRALHDGLRAIRRECDLAQRHDWFGNVSRPLRPTPAMLAAAARHRSREYRAAAGLARHRLDLENDDRSARWSTVIALLAVNWLEPISDDDLFELYVLVQTLDLLAGELEPVQYGLVAAGRSHVAMFRGEDREVRVFFDQTPTSIFRIESRYGRIRAECNGIAGRERRPDILVVSKGKAGSRIVLVEMKNSVDSSYISDGIYKVLAYMYDFQDVCKTEIGNELRAVLVVPTGVSALPHATADRHVFVASADDRQGLAAAMKHALALAA